MSLRIILAENHKLVRAGISALLKENSEYQVIGEADTGMEALRLIRDEKPDLALLGLSLPELNGLDVLVRCAKEFPRTRVVMLSLQESDAYVLQALGNGAHGYLSKDSCVTELNLALQAAARAEIYITSSVARYLVNALNGQGDAGNGRLASIMEPYEKLTPRQRQVLYLIAEGYTTGAIAQKMGLSAGTIKTYRVQLMQQLDIHNTAGLVRYALRAGIINAA